MTTNPNPNTGWIREFPILEGVYFSRVDEGDNDPIPVRVEINRGEYEVFEFGLDRNCIKDYRDGGEWLGPFSPADLEELGRLRSALSRIVSRGHAGDCGTVIYEATLGITEDDCDCAVGIAREVTNP
jgi:hypothetical protein